MRAFFIAILLILAAYALGFVLFVGHLPRAPKSLPEADGVVALTGGSTRLDTAVALFEKGVGKRLLISGVDIDTTKETLGKLSDGGRRFACCADIGYAAEDTHGNASEAADWARANHFHSLVLVTGRYHMPRALSEFQAALPDATLIPWPVEQGSIDLEGWWWHPRTAMLLHREYVKYLISQVTTHLAPA